MKPEFYKKKLKNGLTVLFEKRKLPVVSISTNIKFGSAYESMDNKGISHFIEHLTFKGTKKRSHNQIAREIEKKGGILNAFTGEEYTSFWNKMPSRFLKDGLNIASDLILNPKFDEKEFEKEKKVILEEIKMYHDNPRIYVIEKIKGLLYKKPFGAFGIGTEESLKPMTRKQVSGLFKNYYSTDAMILAIVGNADWEEVLKFGESFPTRKRKLIEHNPIKINSELVEARKGIDQAHFMLGFHIPNLSQKARYDYEIMLTLLAGGMSSILFRELREKRGLCYAVKGDVDIGNKYGYAAIYVGTVKEKIKQVKEIILKEIKNLKNIKKNELEETKEQLIGLKDLLAEDSTNVMNFLVQEETGGEAEEYYKYEYKIKNIKLEDIRKLSKLKAYSAFSLIPE